MALTLTSPAFEENGMIPAKYTCDEDRKLSPPLTIGGAPEGTKSFVLIMDDPDIPAVFKEKYGREKTDHWVLYNIPADTTGIRESEAPGTQGVNTRGEESYTGPCPPPEYEPREHRYMFYLFALSDTLSFDTPPTADQVRAALAPPLLEETKLIGRYSRR